MCFAHRERLRIPASQPAKIPFLRSVGRSDFNRIRSSHSRRCRSWSQLAPSVRGEHQMLAVRSSVTRTEAHGIVASNDEGRSKGENRAVCTGSAVPVQATVSAVWRNRCPNQVRVEPGSTVAGAAGEPRCGRRQSVSLATLRALWAAFEAIERAK